MKKLFYFIFILACALSMVIKLKRHKSHFQSVIDTVTRINKIKNKAGKITLHNFEDLQYYGDFTLGTPPQHITVIVDTGSPEFWINTTGAYDPYKSSTVNITKQYQAIYYGSGYVKGYLGTEMMGVPELNISNAKMVTLFVEYEVGMQGLQADALMGLSNNASWQNVFDIAYKMGQLPDPMFAFDLKSNLLYVGSPSFPYQLSEIKFLPAVMDTYWAINVTNTTIGTGSPIPQWPNMTRSVIDTGTSLLLIDPHIFEQFFKHGGFWDCIQQQGVYICLCLGNHPSLIFHSNEGIDLEVTQENYMIKLEHGAVCVLGVMAMDLSIPLQIFGDVFLRNYFVTYDKQNQRIGFNPPLAKSQK